MQPNQPIKWIILWTMALLITLIAIFYQNRTGPTHPKRIELRLAEEKEYFFKLPRSHGGESNCMIELEIPDTVITGEIHFRRFPTNEDWQVTGLVRRNEKLVTFLPHQPPAGKLEYYLLLKHAGQVFRVPYGEQVVIRFRGDVPAGILIPHASLMFVSMLLSNLVLLLALFNFRQYRLYGWITTVTLLIGGLVFGPLVQKYAFGQLWTGFPLGLDLTDNKTLIAFVFWLIAVLGNVKRDRRYLTVLAALVMLVIFSVPHSARGSELDPATGEVKTGMVIIKTGDLP
jgi:hypothetical protein